MLAPIHIETDRYLIHSFRAQDMKRENIIGRDIYAILSDEATLRYLPGKKLSTLKDAELFFRGNLLSYHAGKNYLHFIREKQSGKIIGIIDLISPEVAKEQYDFSHYPYFIEFYLKGSYQGQGIMSELLPEFIKQLSKENIKEVGAVVNRSNAIARKLIQKVDFSYRSAFDPLQDFYTITLN
jgi:RimJ/RimL family protein N-acetyltransferase